jgi:hypothetical protein
MCRRSRKAVKAWHKPGGAAYIAPANEVPVVAAAPVVGREMSQTNIGQPGPVSAPSPVHYSYPTPRAGVPAQQWTTLQHTGSIEPGTASTTDYYAQSGHERNVSPLVASSHSPQSEISQPAPAHTNVPPPQIS